MKKSQQRKTLPMGAILQSGKLVNAKTTLVSEHEVEKQFLLLSDKLGYLNIITKFVVGNKNSILFLNEQGEFCSPDILDVKKDPKNYFLVYPLPSGNEDYQNDKIVLKTETSMFKREWNTIDKIDLNFKLGTKIGYEFVNFKSISNNDFLLAINGSSDSKRFWPNKNFLINSNRNFLVGLLFGYFSEIINSQDTPNMDMLLQKGDNVYAFTAILNWLGAGYRIRNIEEISNEIYTFDKKIMNLKLPFSLYLDLEENLDPEDFEYVQKYKKYFEKELTMFEYVDSNYKSDKFSAKKGILKGVISNNLNDLNNEIIDGKLTLVNCADITFHELRGTKKEEILYDFTSERADATNFSFIFTPILKNSDGDILTNAAVTTQEGLEDAKEFEPNNKDWFRNLNTGDINQYIADDAILGLYSITKHLDKK